MNANMKVKGDFVTITGKWMLIYSSIFYATLKFVSRQLLDLAWPLNVCVCKMVVWLKNEALILPSNWQRGSYSVISFKMLSTTMSFFYPSINDWKISTDITHICNQRLYLLNQLKKQSLPRVELQSVFVAIVLSCLLYASPAWNGYATASNMESLKKVLIKAKHWQIVDKDFVLEELFQDCDRALFSAAESNNHCLNHLFLVKPNRVHTMSLRPRGHNFAMPLLRYELAKKSFINRSLLCMCNSTSAHDVVLIIFLYIL